MTPEQTAFPTPPKRFRLWPGVIVVILQWLAWFAVPALFPRAAPIGLLVGVLCALAIVVWWVFFSRAPWSERVGALVLMVIALIGTKRIVHESIAGGGMGMLLYILAIPVLSLALVVWAVVTRRFSAGPRRAALVVAILLACGVFTIIRTGGLTAEFDNDIHWRWSKTPEQLLVAQAPEEPAAAAPAAQVTPAARTTDWLGFRGSQRDSISPWCAD